MRIGQLIVGVVSSFTETTTLKKLAAQKKFDLTLDMTTNSVPREEYDRAGLLALYALVSRVPLRVLYITSPCHRLDILAATLANIQGGTPRYHFFDKDKWTELLQRIQACDS